MDTADRIELLIDLVAGLRMDLEDLRAEVGDLDSDLMFVEGRLDHHEHCIASHREHQSTEGG